MTKYIDTFLKELDLFNKYRSDIDTIKLLQIELDKLRQDHKIGIPYKDRGRYMLVLDQVIEANGGDNPYYLVSMKGHKRHTLNEVMVYLMRLSISRYGFKDLRGMK